VHFVQWTDLNETAVLPDITTSSIDHTNDISIPTTTKTTETVSATGQTDDEYTQDSLI